MRNHPYIRSRKGEAMTDSNNDIWVTIDPIPVTWTEPGFTVEGEYIGFEDMDGEYGPYKMYTVQPLDAGAQPVYFAGTKVLNVRMATVNTGDVIRVIYEGIKEEADPPYKQFSLQKQLNV